MTSLLGTSKEYRGVAGAESLVARDKKNDDVSDGAEKKLTARISWLFECPKSYSYSDGVHTKWAFAPPARGLARTLVSASPGPREVLTVLPYTLAYVTT